MVTEIEPAAPEASVQNYDDFAYICVPRENMVTVDNGLTETVHHQVSQSAGPQNAVPVLHSAPEQLRHPRRSSRVVIPAPLHIRACLGLAAGWNWWYELGYGRDRTALGVPDEACRGVSRRPRCFWAAEVKALMDAGSGSSELSEELVEAMQAQPGMAHTALAQAFVGHERVVTSLDQCSLILRRNRVRSTQRSKLHGDQSGVPCRSSCFLGEAMWLPLG